MPKPFENPLTPNARMRTLYRMMADLRQLAPRGMKRLEAAYAATAIHLEPGDLISTPKHAALLAQIPKAVERTRRLTSSPETKMPGSAADHLLCAIGSAIALKAAGEQRVVIAYVDLGKIKPADWRRLLAILAAEELPLLVVALSEKAALSDKLPTLKTALPIIPVDATDAIALYRVMQECLVRARADGRAAIILCIPTRTDPVRFLGEQLLAKRIVTARGLTSLQAERTAIGS